MIELLSNQFVDTQREDAEIFVDLHNELTMLETVHPGNCRILPDNITAGEAIQQCCRAILRLRPAVHAWARQQIKMTTNKNELKYFNSLLRM